MKKFNQQELEDLVAELRPQIDATGQNLWIDCPHCGERECKISIKKEGNLWGCFRLKNCGERGNIYQLLKKIGKLRKITKEFTAEELEYFDPKKIKLFKTEEKSEEQEIILEAPEKKPPLGWTRVLKNDPYLDERNFHGYEDSLVGRTTMDPQVKKDYIVFLVQEDNVTRGWVGRHVWDKKKIEAFNKDYERRFGVKNKVKRYNNSLKTDFSKLLYGYDEIDEKNPLPVCLVEGIFDKHAVDHKLMLKDNRFMYVCATFKAAISIEQILKLKMKNITDIILFYDPDVIKNIKENITKLEAFFNVKVVISNQNKDPDELTREELFDTFETRIFEPSVVKTDFMQIKALKF